MFEPGRCVMDATVRTINFLRNLTMDGYLTSDEVWSLGSFFVQNPECATVWPGTSLSPMLESAFDDAKLNEEEMTVLAETIASVEEEWRMKNPRSMASEREPMAILAREALIPVIDAKFELSSRDAESFVVGLKEHTCTCPDWKGRKSFPERHPGRCCKHVAHAFTRTGKVFEPWFQALLDDCFAHARGTNPSFSWLLFELPEKPAVLVGGGSGPWCNVYAPAQEGYEAFAFNRAQKLWSYGTAPEGANVIERAIQQNFANT